MSGYSTIEDAGAESFQATERCNRIACSGHADLTAAIVDLLFPAEEEAKLLAITHKNFLLEGSRYHLVQEM
ncbi:MULTISPECIES: hypothetical protein [Ensifer]|uniref:hypothetical protein n=1 Tax=Ensifer TaxID=106591 RepID=UPI0008075444|nr:hypothetical protein [Ensifer adhaerens]